MIQWETIPLYENGKRFSLEIYIKCKALFDDVERHLSYGPMLIKNADQKDEL